jgi:hypothetical protein
VVGELPMCCTRVLLRHLCAGLSPKNLRFWDNLTYPENHGYMRHSARCLKKGKNPLLTSHVAISINIVLSTR